MIIAGIIGSVVVIIAIIAITVVNVNSHDPKPEKLQASCLNLNAPSEKDYKFSHSSNLVDLRLFDQVLEQSPNDQNIVFSSLSVISVLSMVLLGKKESENMAQEAQNRVQTAIRDFVNNVDRYF